jgi:orotidine-5'-phosphate decarboxylase
MESALTRLIDYIHAAHPGIPVILDAKRGDIGATATQYAREAYARYRADAVTINPYMGFDSIEPYLAWADKGVILLCRTSNPGGDDLQMREDRQGEKLFERVARLAAHDWNRNGQCALVVGATYPQEIARVRSLAGNMPLLVPGIGAQGGDIRATVSAGRTADGCGLILNSSRAILYAHMDREEQDYAAAARAVAMATREEINCHRG